LIDNSSEWLYYWYFEMGDIDDNDFVNDYFDQDSEAYKYWSTYDFPDDDTS